MSLWLQAAHVENLPYEEELLATMSRLMSPLAQIFMPIPNDETH